MMSCEVNDCKSYPEHKIGIGNVMVGVCANHRKATRKLAKEYGIKMLKTTIDLQDEFMDAVIDIKEEK